MRIVKLWIVVFLEWLVLWIRDWVDLVCVIIRINTLRLLTPDSFPVFYTLIQFPYYLRERWGFEETWEDVLEPAQPMDNLGECHGTSWEEFETLP